MSGVNLYVLCNVPPECIGKPSLHSAKGIQWVNKETHCYPVNTHSESNSATIVLYFVCANKQMSENWRTKMKKGYFINFTIAQYMHTHNSNKHL